MDLDLNSLGVEKSDCRILGDTKHLESLIS